MSEDSRPYLDKDQLLVECMEIIDRHFRLFKEKPFDRTPQKEQSAKAESVEQRVSPGSPGQS